MDFHVDPFESVYPMIPAGAAHNEMYLEDPPEMKRTQKGGPAKKKSEEEEEGEGILPS
jgi:hypothetical protein